MQPLFSKPLGPSQYIEWCIEGFSTTAGVSCEICGTNHPELSQDGTHSYTLFHFLGRQGVEECCGRLMDESYRMFAHKFAEQFLREYAEDPTGEEFIYFRNYLLGSLLAKAKAKLAETTATNNAAIALTESE